MQSFVLSGSIKNIFRQAGAQRIQRSSRRIIQIMVHSQYQNGEKRGDTIEMATSILASGRRVRL